MKNFVRRIVVAVGIFFMLIGVFGLSYTWHYDNRTADSLSEYAKIEFNVSRDGDGNIEGAVMSLWDYRYDRSELLPKAIIFIDGAPWDLRATVKHTPPPMSGDRFKSENKLFVEFPRASLKSILNSESIRFRFFYDSGQSIDLPLNAKDLAAWKRKLRW